MSFTEYHSGKLLKISLKENQTIEDLCKQACLKTDLKLNRCENWKECFYENSLGVCNEDAIFIIFDHIQDDEDFFSFNKESENIYSFHGSFYNGGTCLEEILDEYIEYE